MITIEELMQYGNRRKVQAIALEMGYEPANEYPQEVLEEVKKRTSKGKKRRSATDRAQAAAEEKTNAIADEDLKDIDDAAQHRAAALRVGSDALTLYYYASGQFTNEELKDRVDDSRNKLREAMKGIAAAYDPEIFLAPTRLAELATGKNGLPPSSNGKTNLLPEFVPEEEQSDSSNGSV
jgi:cysteinyl-tRNA synthetase